MNRLLMLLATCMMAMPSVVNAYETNSRRGNSYRIGLELLEDLAAIPEQRYENLQCWKRRNNPNRDLCFIETERVDTADRHLRQYNGNLHFVKQAILGDVNERERRMSALSCWRDNSNRDLCRYERVVVSELNNLFLPEINNAIRNDRARDRRRGDRARDRERERKRRDRERRRRRRGGGRR